MKVFEIIGSTEKSWKKLRKGCHEQFIDQPCMNIWLIIRTSFTNGYVLFDSAMVLLLSLLSVDVSLLLLSSMLLHHTNNLPRYLKKKQLPGSKMTSLKMLTVSIRYST